MTPRVDPQVVSAWKNHQFVFNKSTLTEILQLVRENYGVTVRLTDARFGQKRVSGTFTAQSARELLSVLAEMYALQLQPDNDDFLLISQRRPLLNQLLYNETNRYLPVSTASNWH